MAYYGINEGDQPDMQLARDRAQMQIAENVRRDQFFSDLDCS